MNQDAEHLRLLSVFHYVLAGTMALFSCIPLIHVTLGIVMLLAPHNWGQGAQPPPAFIGLFFILIGGLLIGLGWTLSLFIFLAGKNLSRRRKYNFCFIIAAIMCVFMPLGTVLGVFTIIVLNRPTVKELFKAKENF